MKIQKIQNQLLTICLAVGFFAGILYGNLALKGQGISVEQLQNLNHTVVVEEYLWYVIKVRAFPLLVLLMLGLWKGRKIGIVLGVLWTGFLAGVLLVNAVLLLGIKGVFLCFLGMFPHMLLYGVSFGLLANYLFHYPSRQWNHAKSMFVGLCLFLGIIFETYLNPVLMRWFSQYL